MTDDEIESTLKAANVINTMATIAAYRLGWEARGKRDATVCRATCGEWQVERLKDGSKELRCPCALAIAREGT